MRVVFDLLPGWIELPRAGERPKGPLRRDPFEVLARQMLQAGRVAPHLVGAAAGAMRLFAPGEADMLGVALSMTARTGPDLQSARLHVVGPVETPRLAGGDPDWDAIGAALRQDVRPDPASPTDRVELSRGQGLRVSVADLDAGRLTRHYRLVADDPPELVFAMGLVSALDVDGPTALVDEADRMIERMRLAQP